MKKLKNKKLFLFDIDGTLAIENTLFHGTSDLISYINQIGGNSYFITNNSTKSGLDYVEKFRAWNLETEESQFITSGYMTIEYLKYHHADSKIFALGTSSFLAELRRNGLVVTEEAEENIMCVVVGFDNELTYSKLVKACEILSRPSVSYIATNPDLCCPASFGFIPDCGSICQMLEASTGRKPLYMGKPNKEVVDLCLKQTGFSKEEVLVVGDRLYTDIACGIYSGVETCLVLTGEAKAADVKDTIFKPTYCMKDVAELLNKCKV